MSTLKWFTRVEFFKVGFKLSIFSFHNMIPRFTMKTLRELVKENPLPQFKSIRCKELMSIVLQTLCSIQVAQNVVDFTHYDLHFGNIVIREDDNSPKEIKYTYHDRKNITYTVTMIIELLSLSIMDEHILRNHLIFLQKIQNASIRINF